MDKKKRKKLRKNDNEKNIFLRQSSKISRTLAYQWRTPSCARKIRSIDYDHHNNGYCSLYPQPFRIYQTCCHRNTDMRTGHRQTCNQPTCIDQHTILESFETWRILLEDHVLAFCPCSIPGKLWTIKMISILEFSRALAVYGIKWGLSLSVRSPVGINSGSENFRTTFVKCSVSHRKAFGLEECL